MKTHTSGFKTNIAKIGRDLDSKITYELDGETIELGTEQLNSVTPHYKADILKSVMKQLDIDSNVDIPIGTVVSYQFGVKVGNAYEYLDFGNYIVNKSERQEDLYSYKITCYDKMLLSMVDYEDLEITYPITIRSYINAICTKLGITFANANDTFVNYDKEIPNEKYLDESGNSLGYKFRDVLDELAQVTASTICINEDDELEIRYVQEEEHELKTATGTNIEITDAYNVPIYEDKMSKLSTQDGTPTPENPQEVKTVKGYRSLFDLKSFITNAGETYTENSDGSITFHTASAMYSNFVLFSETDVNISISALITNITTSSFRIELLNSSNNVVAQINRLTTKIENVSANKIRFNWSTAGDVTIKELMLNKGSTILPYVPYGTNWIYTTITDDINTKKILIPLNDNEICGIGNYKDELIVDENGHCWLNKKIGKVVLDGSQLTSKFTINSNLSTTDYNCFFYNDSSIAKAPNDSSICVLSSRFKGTPSSQRTSNITNCWLNHLVSAALGFHISNTITTTSELDDFFTNNNTDFYYVLNEPTLIDLNYIADLTLYEGTNNITNSEDMDMEIKYYTPTITNDFIDEEFFKDVNVDFGKKYGPINSVVLSRSAGADNIYERDEASILANGLCELKIEDNQIMNDNDRDTYLQEIFQKLNGLEYYINDYVSTGIMYYDLCDRYFAHIGDNDYSCVMLNDEALVTQGLQENIHTDMPVVSVTKYDKADKTDRKINQTYLIVDKQNGEIEGLVSKTNAMDTTINNNYQEITQKFNGYTPTSRTVEIENSVRTLQTDTYTKTEINTKLVDGSVQKVQTVSGTFDENGMTYEKTDAPTKTTINEVGVGTKKTDGTDNYILFAGYVDDNNTQFADFKGQTIVASENMQVKNYFVMPDAHSRIEKYENGGGMFYV